MIHAEAVRRVLTHDWEPAPLIANRVIPALDPVWGYHCSFVKEALYYLRSRGYAEMEIRGNISYWRLSE